MVLGSPKATWRETMFMAGERQSYTLELKRKVLEEVDKKWKKADICSEFGIPKSTLSMFVKRRSKLKEFDDVAPTRKHARMSKHHDIDEAVLIWFKQGVTVNVPMNGPMIKTKSTALAREMGIMT